MIKTFKYYSVSWTILVLMFNVIAFIVPNQIEGQEKYGSSFWIGYIFIMLSFVGQLICASVAFKAESNEQLFLNLPLITISYSSLILSIIVGSLCMIIPTLPYWIGVIVCILIFGFTAISITNAKAAIEIVSEIDKNASQKVLYIKSLETDIEILTEKTQNALIKKELNELIDAIKYSDPMSHEKLSVIESKIEVKIAELDEQISTETDENAKKTIEEILLLISERNKKCKILK